MKNNYRKLSQLLQDVDEARAEVNKIAQMRIGVISGGPSIDEEKREFDRAAKVLIEATKKIISNGGRISKIKVILGGEILTRGLIEQAEWDKIEKGSRKGIENRGGLNMGHQTEAKELLRQDRLMRLHQAFEHMTSAGIELLPAGPEVEKFLTARDEVAAWIAEAAGEEEEVKE